MSVGFQLLRRAFWLGALSLAPGALLAGNLTGIRLSSGPLATRVVLDLDQAANHSVFELDNPYRIVIDLPHTAASASLNLPVPKGKVRSVRTGVRPGGELRVVLDVTERVNPKSFILPPEGGFGHRVVIDLDADTAERTEARRITQQYTGRDIVVVIDAGHGGKDPGATGPRGVREKDVVLQIAKRLAAFVNDEPGFKGVLVRDGDRFVSLNNRLALAREAEADFFISIHADSFRDAGASGATVYALDTGRASSETAKRLADRENAADLIGGLSLSDKSDVLARVLLDLSQGAAITKSLDAGEHMISRLSRVTSMRKTTVESGSFLVLTSPDIPSVIIESAYISNPNEESNLRDPAYQSIFAHALFAGIVDYFRTNAPPESYIARNPVDIRRVLRPKGRFSRRRA
jgi:N-acetylmuramoyl-L-alanine amidase